MIIRFKIHGGEFGARKQKRMSKREKEKYGKRKNDKKEKNIMFNIIRPLNFVDAA